MTARPINPHELLDLADRLVGLRAGPGRPKTIELRRGVSSAYYAVFHELAWRGTKELLQDGPGWSPQAGDVSRWVTHAGLRQLGQLATGSGSPALKAVVGTPHPDVVRIGDAVVTLQVARHESDYNDFYDLSRPNALALVDVARQAVDLSAAAAAAGESSYRLLLRLMLSAAQAKGRVA